MVMTVLEAHVAEGKWDALKDAYTHGIQKLDAGIVQTFLVCDTRDRALWRIMTVWQDRAALDAMRASGQTPAGVLMFRAAGAEPYLSILEVAAHAAA